MIRLVVYRPDRDEQSSRFDNFDVIHTLITRFLRCLPTVLRVDVSKILWEIKIDPGLRRQLWLWVGCDDPENCHAAAKIVVALRETRMFTFSWDNGAVPYETHQLYEEKLELDDGSAIVGLGKDFMSKIPFVEG